MKTQEAKFYDENANRVYYRLRIEFEDGDKPISWAEAHEKFIEAHGFEPEHIHTDDGSGGVVHGYFNNPYHPGQHMWQDPFEPAAPSDTIQCQWLAIDG